MSTIQTCSTPAVRLELFRVNRWSKKKGASIRDQIACRAIFKPAKMACDECGDEGELYNGLCFTCRSLEENRRLRQHNAGAMQEAR